MTRDASPGAARRTACRGPRLAALGLSLALGTSVLTGCDFDGAYDLPLPGSPIAGEEAFTITADFADVLNVVPRSPVMVSDVTVGEVTEVERKGWAAEVTMRIRADIELPDNAVAEIRQTSLLGEKFIEVSAPEGKAVGALGEGDHLALRDTSRNPEVEEVLGALSFLLSGGGVGQIKEISTEINEVMTGRTGRVKHLLRELDSLVGTLDDQKDDIIAAMESLNSLTKTLNREKRTIGSALDATGPALKVLNTQHKSLITMLGSLDKLGRVGTRVINGTKDNLIADLKHLKPILRRLNETGDSLPRGLSLLISFPFPQEAMENVKGDYANALFGLDVSLEGILQAAGVTLDEDGIKIPGLPTIPLPDLGGILDSLGLDLGLKQSAGKQRQGAQQAGAPAIDDRVGTDGGLLAGGLG
ncbi:MCE family protein [Nocardioides pacificus]